MKFVRPGNTEGLAMLTVFIHIGFFAAWRVVLFPGTFVWPQIETYYMRHHTTDIKICDTFIWKQRQLSPNPDTDEQDDIDPNCT